MSKMYVCAVCEEPVQMKGEGLKTATCRKHPFRMVTVEHDFSAGKEADRGTRKTPVLVRRHTQVKVVKVKS
jgi:hypothetical protein